MESPRISLVTTCHNAAATIERTITSVLGQRYPRLDYVMIDGGSQDGTGDILRRYRRFFAHVESAPGENRASLAVRGFARAEGDIMAWVDDRVTLAPGTLDFVAWFFTNHPKIDLIYSHRLTIDDQDRATGYRILPRCLPWTARRRPSVPQETCFWRRALYERCGGVDPRFAAAADYDLQVRLLERGRGRRVDRFLAALRQPSSPADPAYGEEVGHIQTIHGMRRWPWSDHFDDRAAAIARRRGDRFAEMRRCRPGNLPGLGWSYDRLWAGTLHIPRENGI